ncbi:MAG: hypothetical protein KFF50_11805 [Desulfatitalea sp.]|nr:hypothetical protein [Desulfatitalea sp.]
MNQSRYTAMVTSDWSECLSPSGPFDVIGFHHPELRPAIDTIFRQYTGNAISLGTALQRVGELLPAPITVAQMDSYLDHAFATYPGVPELIADCLDRGILFMINTTGMIGYFQRVVAKGLLPPLPALSAHPMVRFEGQGPDPFEYHALREIADKATNSAAVAKRFGIPGAKIVVMGDSGGDGPHFEWGAGVGARLIGCMVKPSLTRYCHERTIDLHHHFGHIYQAGEARVLEQEMRFDYRELLEIILKA